MSERSKHSTTRAGPSRTERSPGREPLEEYQRRRHFERTPEPRGNASRPEPGAPRSFVVQAHAARRLHYDFRLELDGVLLSWAVPKGPSLDPTVRRLAVHTEDHPLEYAGFEGVIPRGEYGAGSVIVWDRGTWRPEGDPHRASDEGRMTFVLRGEKLRGRWHLVKTRRADGQQWLLIKGRDEHARDERDASVVDRIPRSVLSGRTLEQVAADPDRVWHSGEDPPAGVMPPDVAPVAGARRAPLPDWVEPQLAILVDAPPTDDRWLHEVKLDGYRILARIAQGEAVLRTRNGNDWTGRIPSLARALASWPVDSALLDGEAVVLDERGISDFQALQSSLSEEADREVVYFVFDLLHLGGWDLRDAALGERKRVLQTLLQRARPHERRVRFGDHVRGHGAGFLHNACEMGLEGMVSKRIDAPYRSGRGRTWLKVKCLARQEVVIGGWTEPAGTRSGLGALLVGMHDQHGALRYAGKVGTGFTERSLHELRHLLEPLQQQRPPFVDPPRGAEARGAHWVRPVHLAEVAFTGITDSGRLRQPSFQGLRQDKSPTRVPRERTGHRPGSVRLTNPDRVLYPEHGITKRRLAQYYAQVADHMLPHVAGRLITLLRCPEGHAGECFYQRHESAGMPEAIRSLLLRDQDEERSYLYIDDLEGLLSLVQLGVLEIHAWGSRADRVEQPDRLVMDLDPDTRVPWSGVVEAALVLRERLARLGLQSFPRTTGGKGVHVVVPIEPSIGWDEAKAFCRALAEGMVRDDPRRYVATMTKARRRGRIYIDYLRNGRAATAIASFSTRARSGAPVATPVRWDELSDVRPDQYDIDTVVQRLQSSGSESWEGFFERRQTIGDAALRALGVRR